MISTLSPEIIGALADRVQQAVRQAKAIPRLTNDYSDMTLSDGYAVQMQLRSRALAQGRRQAGWKIGLTSKAKMEQMGVNVPSIGFLMADMAHAEGSSIDMDQLVHPRIECEIAFMTDKALGGPDISIQDVLNATDFVVPALEIIDSRYADFKFDLPSVVADNGSCARYVVGGRCRLVGDIDLMNLGVVMTRNGQPASMGAAAAVMGHPAKAIAQLVKALSQLGESLPAGSLVLSGAITPAIAVSPGDFIQAQYQELGSVSISFEGSRS